VHRTVRCPRDERLWNSLASGNRSAIIHRTCPVCQQSNGYSAPTVTCRSNKCAPERAEVRHARSGAPDTLQYLSGAPPDSQAGPQVRAPTVGTQWPGDVAGAPDSVRWCTGLSGAPCDNSLHQTASLVVGVINTPNHPTFKLSKFSTFQPLTRARHSIQDTPK
jgi:phage FluMu protein Com